MRKIFLFVGTLMGITTASSAQTQPVAPSTGTAPVMVQRLRLGVNDINPEQQADREASTMAGQLSLSPEQTTRVRAAALVQAQQRLALLKKHNATNDHDALKGEDVAINNQFENELKATLTPTQYERRLMIQARYRKIREQADANEKAGIPPAVRP
ncbi:hypothetical protein Q3A66_13090 [Hymenobacter sp. BT770]|uniref:hypothetical protein n=1 Tax=Hymenobacter sp. BT770 TaxID=2886942 RepID=UPI001D0FAB17|nr:hypothetical protein [Hymenobacter sp. BT770]MCC3153857.1 hypothetical protein [Hymenobacter sp. BT770]MDO3416001.1 hypothetical protein [Hymenobacter sp. BT770]